MKKLLFIALFLFTMFFCLGFIINMVILNAKAHTTLDETLITSISKLDKYKNSKISYVLENCFVSSYDVYSYANSIRYYTCDNGSVFVNVNLSQKAIDYISIHTQITLDSAIQVFGDPSYIRRYGSYVNFIYWKEYEVAFWSLSNSLSPNTTSYSIAYYPYSQSITDLEGWKGFKTYK